MISMVKITIYIYISHDSDVLSETNELIKEILTQYPDMYVTDEACEEFFSIEDINSGNVARWLTI